MGPKTKNDTSQDNLFSYYMVGTYKPVSWTLPRTVVVLSLFGSLIILHYKYTCYCPYQCSMFIMLLIVLETIVNFIYLLFVLHAAWGCAEDG